MKKDAFLITPQSYTQSLSRSEKIVSDKVKAYIKEPSEENVHDLRTSIRRLLTTANVLPKTIRRQKEFKRPLESYEKLLRLNAKVRDVDIILAKLPTSRRRPSPLKTCKTTQGNQRIISQESKTIRIIHQRQGELLR